MRISQAGWDTMVAWCRQGAPLEACGLLGADPADPTLVTRLWPCENAARSTHQFRIAQTDLVRVLGDAHAQGVQVVGAWHSHVTSPAVPSAADLAMAPFPGWVHVIVGLHGPEPSLRAWVGESEIEIVIATTP